MASKLLVYNGALRLLGERNLSGLTEAREPRRVMDDIWDEGAVDFCLSQGQWNFAIRTVKVTYDPDVVPEFGLSRAFSKPSDWIRTSALCWDEYFQSPLLEYSDEAGYWFADVDELYVKYVSNDSSYGGDLGAWPANFTKFVQGYMAYEACPKLTDWNAEKKLELEREKKKRKSDALSSDAMDEPTRFPAKSSWILSRGGGKESNRHGGNIY